MRAPRVAFPLALLLVLIAALTAAAQEAGPPTAPASFDLLTSLVRPLLLAAVFTVVGVAMFIGCIWVIVRMTPFSIQKEIEEDQNMALGLILGAMILGIAIILAAALMG